MSDYLENLAIRSSGAGGDALVQPRLPAMYEASSPGPDLAGETPLSVPADQKPGGTASNRPAPLPAPATPLRSPAGRSEATSLPQEQPFPQSNDLPVQHVANIRPARPSLRRAAPDLPAQVQPPDVFPSEAESAGERAEPQVGSIRPPVERVSSSAPVLPDADGTAEEQPPFPSRIVPPRERMRRPVGVAAQRSLDLTESVESGSEGMGEIRHPGPIDRVRVDRDAAAPSTGLAVPEEMPGRGLSSRGIGSRSEARPAAEGEKEMVPESAPVFPGLSSRPSLQVQGPVPAFSSPPVRRPRNGEAAVASGGGQPPVVRVSIGRVEVRAILPAAPAGPTAPPRPRLSLDEYLQQQNEAKR